MSAFVHAAWPWLSSVLPGDGEGSATRLFLVGKSGAEKSTTENTFFKEHVFKSKFDQADDRELCTSARALQWQGHHGH